jgi:hypothetical protein
LQRTGDRVLTELRESGIRTGIVSYADIAVFDGCSSRAALPASPTSLCSEMARSCKPDPAIFRTAAVSVAPDRAMFVGDSVEADIVRGRVGSHAAALGPRVRRGRCSAATLSHPTTTSITCSMSSTSPSTTSLPTVLLDHHQR